jgi:hypothetical protein
VLEPDLIARSMGGAPRIVRVLLTAEEDTARQRLREREIGSQLAPHVERSAKMAAYLEATAPDSVVRVRTDGRSVTDIAREVIAICGWAPDSPDTVI